MKTLPRDLDIWSQSMSTSVKDQERSRSAAPARWEWQRRIRANSTVHFVYQIVVGIVGFAIIATGIVLLPLPGPGWVIIFVGLGIWASEFVWAARLLNWTKEQVRSWTHWLGRQNIAVRGLVGLAVLALVLACMYGYLLWKGVPGWLPSFVTSPLAKLPGL